MDNLREKCTWDKNKPSNLYVISTIEQTYELADAIIENDLQEIKKELGDLLFYIVFYAKITSETNHFDITEVINVLLLYKNSCKPMQCENHQTPLFLKVFTLHKFANEVIISSEKYS